MVIAKIARAQPNNGQNLDFHLNGTRRMPNSQNIFSNIGTGLGHRKNNITFNSINLEGAKKERELELIMKNRLF